MENAVKTEKGQAAREIQRLKKALEISESKFAAVFEHTPLGLSITRVRDNTVVEVNASYIAFTGYTRDAIIGKKVTEMNIWDDPREREAMLKKLKDEGRIENEEHNLRTRLGEIHPVLLSVEPIVYMDEDCLLVTAVDIFQRRKGAAAIAESEEKFSKAFSVSANAMCITSLADGKFFEINDAYSTFTGYSREEVIDRTATELNLWPFEDELKHLQSLLQKDGKFRNVEFHSRCKDGEVRTGLGSAENITIHGEPYRLVVITDITERKKIEEALKESEEKFYKAFSASANAIGVIGIQDGKYIDANESFFRFTGYSREEIVGHNPAELDLWVYPEEQQKWISTIRKDSRAVNHEFHSRRKSGEIRIALASADIISIGGKPCRILSITDITDLKKAQEALRESEDFNSTLLTHTPNAIFVTYPDGTIKYVNPAFEKLTGFSLAEIIGTKRPYPWWPEGKKCEIEASLEKTTQGEEIKLGEQSTRQMTFQKKNGELFIVELNAAEINKNGQRQYIMVVWTDITERKRAEEALKNSEENFHNSLDESPLGVRIVNREGETVYANRALLDIYGYSDFEELKAINPAARFTPEMYEKHLQMRDLMKGGSTPPPSGETSIVRKNGEVRRLQILTKEVLWNGQRQFQLQYLDITDRKEAEEKLNQAMGFLEQSNGRLASANKELEAFSYSVSHDLRSPLRSIDGFSQALLEDYSNKLDATGQDYLRRVRNASQKMGELIDGMLRLSRLSRSELHIEKVDLGAIARDITGRLKENQPERDSDFIIEGDLTAQGDPQLLRALLENLLGNAWKFTSKAPQTIIEFGAKQEASKKVFYVRDNGAGFDMTYVDKLFGAFQRLHDVTDYPGTGIGLATVQRIINRHGGTVRAEGEVGKGATFYFTLS